MMPATVVYSIPIVEGPINTITVFLLLRVLAIKKGFHIISSCGILGNLTTIQWSLAHLMREPTHGLHMSKPN